MIFAHAALTSGMGCATMVSAITGMFGRKAEEKFFLCAVNQWPAFFV